MGVNSLPKTVTRQHRGCDLNPGPSAAESSMLTTRLPSHPQLQVYSYIYTQVYTGQPVVPATTGNCALRRINPGQSQ